jgi:hypothetical protein
MFARVIAVAMRAPKFSPARQNWRSRGTARTARAFASDGQSLCSVHKSCFRIRMQYNSQESLSSVLTQMPVMYVLLRAFVSF